ncbi:MAG: hypothetical protein K6G17_07420 [Oscillospiraceae bacterium]|nr:hypothetical protein [Oscillospiraceae bacterium]
MAGDLNVEWGRSEYRSLLERWPKDAQGCPERPVLLRSEKNLDMGDELLVNMLEAYQIPCLRLYPGDGSFGRVVLGVSGWGVDVYVPESLYEDAKALCEGEGVEDHEQL